MAARPPGRREDRDFIGRGGMPIQISAASGSKQRWQAAAVLTIADRMSAPFFSIIVPCRNAAATLARTLASVSAQTEGDRELIVVDGASSDGSAEILAARRAEITRLVSEPDAGVYAAMNKGVRLASGAWLLFLGANDALLAPDVLARVRAGIGGAKGGVYCGEAEYADGRVWLAPRAPHVKYRNFMHHQSSFYHRSLFAGDGYDERFRIQADYDFNLRLWLAGVRPQPLHVRVAVCATGGLSDGGTWANYRDEIAVRHQHFSSWGCWLWDAGSVARFVRKAIVRRRRVA